MPTPASAPYTADAQPRPLNNMRGVALMLAGFFAFAAGDMQAKLLTADLHPFQIVWFRQSGLFIGVVILLAIRGLHVLRTPRPGIQISRGLVAVGSASCFIFAIGYVPLADATAVSFVAPFIVTVLGALVLREPVGMRRWMAVAVGFVGMLIVIRPGLGVFHPAILLVVVAASFFALRQILSRTLSGTDSIATIVAYTAITSFAVLSLVQPFVFQLPGTPRLWALIIGMTCAAALGEVLIIRALDIAQSVVLAPIHYSLIIWSTFYGYIVFSDLPDLWTWIGSAVIVASGLYTLHRERRLARKAG